MKHVLLSCIFICTAGVVPAQSWFTEHPVWTNDYYSSFTGPSIEVAQITGDTLVGGFTAQKMRRQRTNVNSGNTYSNVRIVRQTGDTIWVWGSDNQFHRQYDFSLTVGGIIAVTVDPMLPLVYYHVDSIGTMAVNGHDLRFQRLYRTYPTVLYKTIVLEGIGAVSGICYPTNNEPSYLTYEHFFLDEPDRLALDGPRRTLCKYSNDQLTYQSPYANCAAITPTHEISNQVTFVTPNPFQDVLHVQVTNGQPVEQVRLYDLYGKMVVQQTECSDIPLNTSQLAAGMYFLELYFSDGQRSMTKVVKE